MLNVFSDWRQRKLGVHVKSLCLYVCVFARLCLQPFMDHTQLLLDFHPVQAERDPTNPP